MRKWIIRMLYKFFSFCFQILLYGCYVSWSYLTPEDVNHYTDWLGPRDVQAKE